MGLRRRVSLYTHWHVYIFPAYIFPACIYLHITMLYVCAEHRYTYTQHCDTLYQHTRTHQSTYLLYASLCISTSFCISALHTCAYRKYVYLWVRVYSHRVSQCCVYVCLRFFNIYVVHMCIHLVLYPCCVRVSVSLCCICAHINRTQQTQVQPLSEALGGVGRAWKQWSGMETNATARATNIPYMGMHVCNVRFVAYCNALHHTASHCNTLHHTASQRNTLQHTATHYNTMQHTATHCSTL